MSSDLKTYAAPWEGQVILACAKCQKKLKHDKHSSSIARLKKTVRRYNKHHPDHLLQVINVPCMDLCPKRAVTVCLPARDPNTLSILRVEKDLERLF